MVYEALFTPSLLCILRYQIPAPPSFTAISHAQQMCVHKEEINLYLSINCLLHWPALIFSKNMVTRLMEIYIVIFGH